MKKVLICDDEFLVRTGLETTIPWNEYGFGIVGCARNGKEALDLFDSLDPDILLTDIRMPIMDGLELIKIAKAKKPSLQAFILTHYDDFKYLKEALHLGATDYILKSELSPENLIHTLTSHGQSPERPAEEPKIVAGGAYNEAYFCNLLLSLSNGSSLQAGLSHHFQEFNLILQNRYFAVFSVHVFHSKSFNPLQPSNSGTILVQLQNIANNSFGSDTKIYIAEPASNVFLGLVFFSKVEEGSIDLTQFANQIKRNANYYLNIELIVGISKLSNDPNELMLCINQANTAYLAAYFTADLYADALSPAPTVLSKQPSIDLVMLNSLADFGNVDEMLFHLSPMLYEIEQHKDLKALNLLFEDILAFVNYRLGILSQANETPGIDALKSLPFESLCGFDAVKKYFALLFSTLCKEKCPNASKLNYSMTVRKCIEYIQRNYQKNISLSDAAGYVKSSKSYLSSLFKQETTIKFSAYLTNFRLNKAKELLEKSNYRIYEISEMVGFDNPYYFSKVFKDYLGVSSKDYRINHSKIGSQSNFD